MNRRSFISLMFGLGLISQRTTLKTPVNESKEQHIEVSGSSFMVDGTEYTLPNMRYRFKNMDGSVTEWKAL